jgi:hypothetical protein
MLQRIENQLQKKKKKLWESQKWRYAKEGKEMLATSCLLAM